MREGVLDESAGFTCFVSPNLKYCIPDVKNPVLFIYCCGLCPIGKISPLHLLPGDTTRSERKYLQREIPL